MAMQRTEGFYKAYIDVTYTNDAGTEHHLASFQIATSTTADYCENALRTFGERGEVWLPLPIQAYLEAMRANLYELTITAHLMV